MSVIVLIARFALAAVFVVAAAGKLADLDGSRRTIEQFGLSARLAGPLGLLLPLAELAIAACLIDASTAPWAALAAISLLCAFCIAIVRVLMRGEAPACNCFGTRGSTPVGRRTLARNGTLIALAVFAAAAGWNDGGVSAFAWIADQPAFAAVAGVLAVVSGIHLAFSWQLFRQNARLLDRVSDLEATLTFGGDDRLAIGEPAPDFALPDLEGRTVALADLLAAGRGVLLLFTNPACAQCNPILHALGRTQAVLHGTPVAVVSAGTAGDNREKTEKYGLSRVLLQDGFEVAERYHVHASPGALLVDEDGRIASEPATGVQSVMKLLEFVAGVLPESIDLAGVAGELVVAR